jgi:hypothetical protein
MVTAVAGRDAMVVVEFMVPALRFEEASEVAKTLVAVRLLENQTFPLTDRAFPKALVPMPIFDVATKVPTFACPVMFAEVAKTLVVRKLLENQAFPPTVRFADAPARIRMLYVSSVSIFAVQVMFEEVAKTLVVVRLLENQAFPLTTR